MSSKAPLHVAFERARQLQGVFILDAAAELRFPIDLRDKGWIGKMAQFAITGEVDEVERELPDLSQAGVEIKAFGVGQTGDSRKPWEPLRLRAVDYEELVKREWHQSKLLSKMRATVMVPYFRPPIDVISTCRCAREPKCRGPCRCTVACSCGRWCPCRGNGQKSENLEEFVFLQPFLWVPSTTMIESFRIDWERHAARVRAGGSDPLGSLEDNFGKVLRAATQGQTSASNWRKYVAQDGQEYKAKGRAWFLRKEVLAQICAENDVRVWPALWETDTASQ